MEKIYNRIKKVHSLFYTDVTGHSPYFVQFFEENNYIKRELIGLSIEHGQKLAYKALKKFEHNI